MEGEISAFAAHRVKQLSSSSRKVRKPKKRTDVLPDDSSQGGIYKPKFKKRKLDSQGTSSHGTPDSVQKIRKKKSKVQQEGHLHNQSKSKKLERKAKSAKAVKKNVVGSRGKNTEESDSSELGNTGIRDLTIFDSVKVGEGLFSWLISPVEIDVFFKTIWEKKPLHITRNTSGFYNKICTVKDFKKAFKLEEMYFTKNIDVTCYVNGKRVTENPTGRAKPSIIWDLYKNGRSIRLLNPQTFLKKVRILTTTLQEYFRCFVGANMYLTPPNSQGFAPHYDDIEAFVLQLDGKKHWKLYNPRSNEESLPRESSKNFNDEEIGKPILEVTLEPGDLLYFPRGTIHQACCSDERSLHITISCYQKNSWADLLEKAIPVALQRAIEEDVEFREGLPINYLDHLGLVHSDSNSSDRQLMINKLQRLLSKLITYCPIDASADQLGKNFMHDALPPLMTKNDINYGADDTKYKLLFRSLHTYEDKKLGIKLVRAYVCRLISEEFSIKLYYNTDNSKEYHGEDAMCLDIPLAWASMVECLIKQYPAFVDIQTLKNIGDGEGPVTWSDVVEFVYEIWRRGLIIFDKPISQI